MCGIAGALGLSPDELEQVGDRMLRRMRHRGPDDEGTALLADAGGRRLVFAHTRLSILDLSDAGHQPMHEPAAQGRACVIFNGELYNFRELRAELEREGFTFRTACDTEVLLHAWRRWGEAAVERFDGMFAFVLADPDRGTVWFARDRLGIKPLYLARLDNGAVLFASELRALLAAGPRYLRPRVNRVALESFLAQGMVCGLDTIVEGAQLLGPAESVVMDFGGRVRSQRRYWRLPFRRAQPYSWRLFGEAPRKSAVEQIGEALRAAVRSHLVSDAPLGLFLSGGVDSSAVTAIAREVSGIDVRTLSIGFDQPRFDESGEAAQIAAQLGTEHQTLRLTGGEIVSDIHEAFAAMDQPTVDGFNTFFVARAARRAGLKVALSGLGGDELFGGYASFRDVPITGRIRSLTASVPVDPVVARTLRLLPGRGALKTAELFRRPHSPVQAYFLRRELFLPDERRLLHPLPPGSSPNEGVSERWLDELEAATRPLDPENQVSHLELNAYMQHMLLRDADVFSMAVGLELRVPLLDHRLVEIVSDLPGAWKRPGARPKPLLLDAVGPRLPTLSFNRPKRGFAFPWADWIRGPLRRPIEGALADRDVWRSLGFNDNGAQVLWSRFLAGDRRISPLQIIALWVLREQVHRLGLSVA